MREPKASKPAGEPKTKRRESPFKRTKSRTQSTHLRGDVDRTGKTRRKAIDAKLAEIEQIAKLLRLKTQGYRRFEIAQMLGVDLSTVNKLWERAYEDFIGDKNALFDTKLAEIMAGHEYMIQQWSKKAETNTAAAHIVLRARREISRMCGHGNANFIVENSGSGPVITVNASPMEAARLVRESFGSKVKALSPPIDVQATVEDNDGSTH